MSSNDGTNTPADAKRDRRDTAADAEVGFFGDGLASSAADGWKIERRRVTLESSFMPDAAARSAEKVQPVAVFRTVVPLGYHDDTEKSSRDRIWRSCTP